MELGLEGRVISVCGPDDGALAACRLVLAAEGAQIAESGLGEADIVIAAGRVRAGSDLLAAADADELYGAWTDVTAAVDSYRAALPRMTRQRWGRLVWIGSAQAKSVDAEADELGAVASLGMLGLNKVVTGELGSHNITANAVLRGGLATDADVADAVAFLCSDGAGYLSGITITVDGGAGSAVF
ncbi:MAG: family oxidoreductase [Frankiales bacterium]|nr:family oxidoreductase [Frankiales bacterium]